MTLVWLSPAPNSGLKWQAADEISIAFSAASGSDRRRKVGSVARSAASSGVRNRRARRLRIGQNVITMWGRLEVQCHFSFPTSWILHLLWGGQSWPPHDF